MRRIAVLLMIVLSFSLMAKEKHIKLNCLQDSVKVIFDKWGVPHIYANNVYDAIRMQGYLHVRDRFWSMELTRRATEGRLSELFGKDFIDADVFLRTLGFKRMALEMWNNLPEDEKKIFYAYTEGVNEYIKQGKKPIELKLLGIKKIEEWKPYQSLGYIRLMAWDLTNSYKYDYVLGKLYEKLDSTHFSYIVPYYPQSSPPIIDVDTAMIQGSRIVDSIIKGLGVSGSNSWAVTGKKSYSGKPILCNDPHLSFSMPTLWYEIHIHTPEINLYGVSLPSLPFVVIGHTDKFAWGLTNVMTDDADFIIEEVNPDDTTQYLRDDGWHKFTYIEETLFVKKEKPYIFKVKLTDYGPVVSSLKNDNRVLSFKWTAYMKTDEFRCMYKLPYVKNVDDFIEAASYFQVPGQNFLYADNEGNICYVPAVGIPKRPYNNYILPIKWNDEGAKWTQFVPFDSIPKLINPSSQYIVTANNPILKGFNYYVSMYWEPDQRSLRIIDVLNSADSFTTDDMKRLQFDFHPPQNAKIRDMIVKACNNADLSKLEKSSLEILKKWNGEEDKDMVGPTIYYYTIMNAMEYTFKDEMDTLWNDFISMNNLAFRIFLNIMDDENNIWFDDIKTDSKEDRDSILLKSFVVSVKEISQKLGKNPNKWRWGKVHKISFDHPFGSKNWLLKKIFSRGDYEFSGSPVSICKAQWQYAHPFKITSGPSTRQIVNLSSIDSSLAVIPTGNTGRIFSKHYADQIKLWLNGKYHNVYMSKDKIDEVKEEVWIVTNGGKK